MQPDWLRPDWSAGGVGGLMTTRRGGVSAAPYDSMNLRAEVGDSALAVARNQALFAEVLGGVPVFLNQVHGARVVQIGRSDMRREGAAHEADAAVTTEPGVACTVMVADCLPVLFAAPAGRGVGAAHAGWRGLAGGVLENTIVALCDAAGCAPGELQAWMGACIGPRRFEVGADVLQAFGVAPRDGTSSPRFAAALPGKWMADLAGLARDRLQAAGVHAVSGGGWCTVEDGSRFFSFRRDGVTGRMAAAVWIDRAGG
jgi:polyphenol oxidase